MRVTVYGAARDVTGSCYLLETDTARILIDCGLFQGSDKLEQQNYIPRDVLKDRIDAVLLTHGHLDHCGRLPLLYKAGYRGPIYMTEPTIRITRLILSDSARIQQDDAEYHNRHKAKNQKHKFQPLYDTSDVDQTCKQFRQVDYNQDVEISTNVRARFVEAGHILGSACIELSVYEEGAWKKLVFSGDLGSWDIPILRDPARIETADVVFMETTYGDRDHRSLTDTLAELEKLLVTAIANKGRVLIPTFAVGRTQLILFYLAQMIRNRKIPPVPIYLDSPMAISATDIYANLAQYMDAESQQLHQSGQLALDLQTLRHCISVDESKALNNVPEPCIILAGAGMCNAGRIMHHLRRHLNERNTLVLMVGFQPKGSLGRALVDGAATVKLFGETIPVRATIKGLGGFSAHGGQTELLRWFEPMAASKPQLFLMHGEVPAMTSLASLIHSRWAISAIMPKMGEKIDISFVVEAKSKLPIA